MSVTITEGPSYVRVDVSLTSQSSSTRTSLDDSTDTTKKLRGHLRLKRWALRLSAGSGSTITPKLIDQDAASPTTEQIIAQAGEAGVSIHQQFGRDSAPEFAYTQAPYLQPVCDSASDNTIVGYLLFERVPAPQTER